MFICKSLFTDSQNNIDMAEILDTKDKVTEKCYHTTLYKLIKSGVKILGIVGGDNPRPDTNFLVQMNDFEWMMYGDVLTDTHTTKVIGNKLIQCFSGDKQLISVPRDADSQVQATNLHYNDNVVRLQIQYLSPWGSYLAEWEKKMGLINRISGKSPIQKFSEEVAKFVKNRKLPLKYCKVCSSPNVPSFIYSTEDDFRVIITNTERVYALDNRKCLYPTNEAYEFADKHLSAVIRILTELERLDSQAEKTPNIETKIEMGMRDLKLQLGLCNITERFIDKDGKRHITGMDFGGQTNSIVLDYSIGNMTKN